MRQWMQLKENLCEKWVKTGESMQQTGPWELGTIMSVSSHHPLTIRLRNGSIVCLRISRCPITPMTAKIRYPSILRCITLSSMRRLGYPVLKLRNLVQAVRSDLIRQMGTKGAIEWSTFCKYGGAYSPVSCLRDCAQTFHVIFTGKVSLQGTQCAM